ncbi:hypothetical protein [Nocardia vulneris]|uniref:FAD-binding domain-containing protein n=1 Tax=Nocardia vulneris TaxID=1141657 RepID=A0ABR4ZH62_9NOCA|nr:hypothetical protein [Nocardia vulneris]KIA64339.1 hypothetical protein FG87_13875 [Nocardia vulneris]
MTQVVILGAGIAGLLATAAAAASGCVDQVVLVDSDILPADPVPRRNIPQAAHVHGLLASGCRAVDQLVPDFLDTVVDLGGVAGDFARDVALGTPFGWAQRFPSDLRVVGASRDLIEWAIRVHVSAMPGVQLLCGHTCTGLLAEPSSTAVIGAQLSSVDWTTIAVPADLVIDATGRGSRADRWLTDLNLAPPPTVTVDSHAGYASRVYTLSADYRPDWLCCYLPLVAPHHPRGGLVCRIEGDRYRVSLFGVGSDRPTRHEENFLSFARSLHDPTIAEIIDSAEPVTPVRVTTATSNRRRYPERTARYPANFVHVGDALCCLNPIYGQGMSVAANAAVVLGRQLAATSLDRGFAARFHRAVTPVTQWAWTLATSADVRWPGATSPNPVQRIMGRHLDRVMAAATRSPRVQQSFLDVMHLLRSPISLAAPPTLLRTFTAARGHADRTLEHDHAMHANSQETT